MEKQAAAAHGSRKPVAIPQVTKSSRGTFYSPFMRAYPPDFAAWGISHETFIRFVDGLNEAFLTSPIFQATSDIGGAMGVAPFHPVAWAGLGLQVASELVSAGVSYGRTRAYIKKANTDLFGPVGYRADVLTTKKMMTKVGLEGDQLELPGRIHPSHRSSAKPFPGAGFAPIPETNEEIIAAHAARYQADQPQPFPGSAQMHPPVLPDQGAKPESAASTREGYFQMPDVSRLGINIQNPPEDDPRLRRLKALEGYVQPLEIENSPPDLPDNWFKRMGAKHAEKVGKKQDKKQRKKQAKSDEKAAKHDPEFRIKHLQDKLQRRQAEADRKLEKETESKKQRKIVRKMEEDTEEMNIKIHKTYEKLEKQERKGTKQKEASKADKKQQKIANKIQWVVIFPIESEVGADEDDMPVSESECSSSGDEVTSEYSDRSSSFDLKSRRLPKNERPVIPGSGGAGVCNSARHL